ncbi:hypothetical protein IKQ21_05180 [bacterium]|nr:hypothetical protein [bacterium]
MLINKISNFSNIKNINFRENELSREMVSQNAILMLRDPNASVRFQQNQEIAQNADALSTSPIKALGYKLYRTFSMLSEDIPTEGQEQEQKHLNTIA